uniref:Uncharacterized protein n=1 Tax=Ficedula albicollis TaxID=59894 RepID=A0A803VCM6_FICAL
LTPSTHKTRINYLDPSTRYEVRNPGINYLDPSTSAFANSIWHSSTRWINHRHQSYKAELVYREVQVICIKLEAIRKLIIRQSQVAESCNTSNPDLLCRHSEKHLSFPHPVVALCHE